MACEHPYVSSFTARTVTDSTKARLRVLYNSALRCSSTLISLIGAREEKREKMREKEEASLTQQQPLTEREVDSQKSLAKSRLKDGEPACHSPRNCMLISKQTKVAGAENGLRAALDPQFGEDMAHVQLDRPWCHDQGPCNLLVGSPTC